jgi:hypothetical protein
MSVAGVVVDCGEVGRVVGVDPEAGAIDPRLEVVDLVGAR